MKRHFLLTYLLCWLALALPASAAVPPGRYTVSSGTVYDTFTQLTWQQAVPATPVATGCSGTNCTQAGAIAYCNALTLGGSSDWRLPTVSELLTLVDPTQYDPAIDGTAFPSTPAMYFWSSSAYVGAAGYAWVVFFSNGDSASYGTGSAGRVRCVR